MATVDGAEYTVLNDISSIILPPGFYAVTADYNGTEVAVARDANENYTLYYLKSAEGEAVEPYVLNGDIFERLQSAAVGDWIYIFAEVPTELKAPEWYYETAVKICDFSVIAFVSSNSEYTDFYYVYCYYDNGYRIYRYDIRENTFQRSPEFKLVTAEDEKISKEAGFIARFSSLSANAKTLVIGLVLAAIAAIALVILLIINLVNGR